MCSEMQLQFSIFFYFCILITCREDLKYVSQSSASTLHFYIIFSYSALEENKKKRKLKQ